MPKFMRKFRSAMDFIYFNSMFNALDGINFNAC